jgi:hypothetical protein
MFSWGLIQTMLMVYICTNYRKWQGLHPGILPRLSFRVRAIAFAWTSIISVKVMILNHGKTRVRRNGS